MDYTLKQAAEFLCISYTTIKAWVAKGIIVPDYRLPSGRVRFLLETLEDAKQPIEKPQSYIESPAAKKRRAEKVKDELYRKLGLKKDE